MAVMPAAEHTYDVNNRLKMEQTVGGGKTPFTTYLYDANGNLTASINPAHRTDYAYNGFNQLMFTWSGRSGTAYTYNAQGIRTSKVTANNTVKFLLDGGNVVGEVRNEVLTAAYLRGINLIRRVIMSGAEYYLFNGHGDVVGLTDSTGGVTQSYDYDAFGNEKNPDSADTNPFRYCGEYFDTETGTYYLRARYYDPTIGRFTQQDTHWSPANAIYGDNPRQVYERTDALGLSTYSYAPEISAIMQSGNLYVYCVNNPICYHDSTGETLTAEADVFTSWLQTALGLSFIDGPLPIMEAILCAVTAIIAVDVTVTYLADAAKTREWVRNKIDTGGEDPDNLKNHSVYVIYKNGTRNVWYVGRTSDFGARKSAHQGTGGKFPAGQFTMIPVKTDLDLAQARALEETLICAFLTELYLKNAIHSIAYKNWWRFEEEFQQASSLIYAFWDD